MDERCGTGEASGCAKWMEQQAFEMQRTWNTASEGGRVCEELGGKGASVPEVGRLIQSERREGGSEVEHGKVGSRGSGEEFSVPAVPESCGMKREWRISTFLIKVVAIGKWVEHRGTWNSHRWGGGGTKPPKLERPSRVCKHILECPDEVHSAGNVPRRWARCAGGLHGGGLRLDCSRRADEGTER